jgi:hypothetical protein
LVKQDKAQGETDRKFSTGASLKGPVERVKECGTSHLLQEIAQLKVQLARQEALIMELKAAQKASLAVAKALMEEAAAHPDKAGHPLAHKPKLRAQIFDKAYKAANSPPLLDTSNP